MEPIFWFSLFVCVCLSYALSRERKPRPFPETLSLTVPYAPLTKAGERLTITAFLLVRAERPDVSTEVQRLAQSEISLWALGFTELSEDSYSSLQRKLAGISGERYRVLRAAVISIAPPKTKTNKQPPSLIEELMNDVKTVKDLMAFREMVASAYPELREDPDMWAVIENKIESKKHEILDPVSV